MTDGNPIIYTDGLCPKHRGGAMMMTNTNVIIKTGIIVNSWLIYVMAGSVAPETAPAFRG